MNPSNNKADLQVYLSENMGAISMKNGVPFLAESKHRRFIAIYASRVSPAHPPAHGNRMVPSGPQSCVFRRKTSRCEAVPLFSSEIALQGRLDMTSLRGARMMISRVCVSSVPCRRGVRMYGAGCCPSSRRVRILLSSSASLGRVGMLTLRSFSPGAPDLFSIFSLAFLRDATFSSIGDPSQSRVLIASSFSPSKQRHGLASPVLCCRRPVSRRASDDAPVAMLRSAPPLPRTALAPPLLSLVHPRLYLGLKA